MINFHCGYFDGNHKSTPLSRDPRTHNRCSSQHFIGQAGKCSTQNTGTYGPPAFSSWTIRKRITLEYSGWEFVSQAKTANHLT